jgi:phospholipase C
MHVITRRASKRSTARAVTALCATAVLVAAAGVTARGSTAALKPVPSFTHVVVIVLENKEYGDVVGSSEAPAFAALARRYALLTNYRGVAHPSLPNYLALVSGSTQGITSDCTDCAVDARSLADTLEDAGKRWKTYAEGLPSSGFTGAHAGRYAKKHDPFVYFRDVTSNPARLRRVVPLSAFAGDLHARRLPDFALVVPDLCHDMHDCPVATGDAWLSSFLKPLLGSAALGKGVVFVVFDEGSHDDSAGGGGHVPALVLGNVVRAGSRFSAPIDHYGLLRTIEDAWHLPRLGISASATPITGVWRR